jgi:predicted XRE-type DNA-binding protein
MLAQGFRQQDIAAIWGVNSGRVSNIATGKKFSEIPSASEGALAAFLTSRRRPN